MTFGRGGRMRTSGVDQPESPTGAVPGPRPLESWRSRAGEHHHHRLRPANTMSDMDIRASDKLPGAKVRLRRRPQPGPYQMPAPREWLARADGAVQEVRTEGPSLTLIGQPLPYQPGRAERRSGIPAEVITSEHVPSLCTCSWAYSQGKLTLKHYNAACPVHLPVPGR